LKLVSKTGFNTELIEKSPQLAVYSHALKALESTGIRFDFSIRSVLRNQARLEQAVQEVQETSERFRRLPERVRDNPD